MKQSAMNHRHYEHRRLMREIYWHRMLGNLMLQLPWVNKTSPMVIRRVRKLNTCCVELHRLEEGLLIRQPTEKTAA